MGNPYALGPADQARYQELLRTVGRGGPDRIVSAVAAAASDSEAAWSLRVLAHLAWEGLSAELRQHSTAPDQVAATSARIKQLLRQAAGPEPGATTATQQFVHYALEGAGYQWRTVYHVQDPLTQRPTPN